MAERWSILAILAYAFSRNDWPGYPVREERLDEVADRAETNAEERVLDLLMPPRPEPSESVDRTRGP